MADARGHDRLLIRHSPPIHKEVGELTTFLYDRFYRHEHLRRFSEHARRILCALFSAFVERPEELAPWYRRWADDVGTPRAVCDYLAGMTARFAEQEFQRLTHEPL